VTTKERLHKLVDGLSESEADDALRYIAQRHMDPMVAASATPPKTTSLSRPPIEQR
jgi:hypothetical protein